MDQKIPNILIVDDNEDNLELLSRRLQKKNYATVCANSGKKALALLDEQTFDLVLLDIMMPEMSGTEVLEIIRSKNAMEDLPVIMATAKDTSEDMVHSFELGASDYITKPIDFPVLFSRLKTQLALKAANDRNNHLVRELEARNDFIRSIFGRYVSDNVVEQLLTAPDALRLGGETKNLTIMFSDIRGFTPIAEALPPTSVVEMLNNYFGVMTDVVDKHQGTINEFYGDGILIFFGAPLPMEEHAQVALECACSMQQHMSRVNELNREAGLPELEMGIGINTGNVVVGTIGAHTRSKYGIVGSSVNLAARIQAKAAGGEVLAAETTLMAAGQGVERLEARTIEAKGIEHPVSVYQIMVPSDLDSLVPTEIQQRK
ncbi:MAG: adenylate/guanylate cyclase domain-containing protein [Acidiferrobacterales bacterium]